MPKLTISRLIQRWGFPSAMVALLAYGWGGKQLPTVNAMVDGWEKWLNENTDYPTLVVGALVGLFMWGLYQGLDWWFSKRRKKWRGTLIALLHDGIRLRNNGKSTIFTTAAAAQWVADAEAWRKKVGDEIRRVDPNEADDFALLDVSPAPRLPIETPILNHAWHYQHHDYRLVRLRDLTRLMR